MFLKEKEIGGQKREWGEWFFYLFLSFGIFNIGIGGFIEILRRIWNQQIRSFFLYTSTWLMKSKTGFGYHLLGKTP